MRQIREPFQQFGGLGRLGVQTGLGFLRAELDLNQDRQALAQFGGGIVQPVGQRCV